MKTATRKKETAGAIADDVRRQGEEIRMSRDARRVTVAAGPFGDCPFPVTTFGLRTHFVTGNHRRYLPG